MQVYDIAHLSGLKPFIPHARHPTGEEQRRLGKKIEDDWKELEESAFRKIDPPNDAVAGGFPQRQGGPCIRQTPIERCETQSGG